MTLFSLIDPINVSDSGGVAGRVGYDFQAHVAAGFVLDMLVNPDLLQVECETADDVTLRWERDGRSEIEYVQVKSTEEDGKWGIGEITSRDQSKRGSSLMEKSLACDKFPGTALFRFVSTREIRKDLILFKLDRSQRSRLNSDFDALVRRFAKKYPDFKSKNGKNTEYWARNLLWEVAYSESAVETRNTKKLLRAAEGQGVLPSYKQAELAYDNLLKAVTHASKASRVTNSPEKSINRKDIWPWWDDFLNQVREDSHRTIKVYTLSTDEFFTVISEIDDLAIRRALRAFDAEFDGGQWREADLASYLLDWLPEVALPAKVLASHNYLGARQLTQRALEVASRNPDVEIERLVAELLLHSILRHYHKSEPIACKLFTTCLGHAHKNTAQIVSSTTCDEIWLGQGRLATVPNRDDVASEIFKQITEIIDRKILKSEREVIIQLRDPDHMRSANLARVLSKYAKMDEFLNALRIPILLAYDSEIIAKGELPGYVEELKKEAEGLYAELKRSSPAELKDIPVHIFLVPIKCAVSLVNTFREGLDGR
ncbi:DUF1837 domain-containing protein [Leisingera aquaemixtae]|uniref:HamA C-terminal domain-containing protein n=1 Tax=Leisingera aquaemixtae TaxID=1396826 RepID=UPI001C968D25|nr:Hachiman antiphage defense system protein HamA [Leisingera aquaemixtae]MBY6067668.1 DUF1837 domain-containing protein [Leisingera aquaemixtae]